MIGTWVLIIALLVCTRNSPAPAKFVFTDFENHTGWSNNGFVVLLGLLQSQYSFTGYDSAAHMVSHIFLVHSPYSPQQILIIFGGNNRLKRHRMRNEEDLSQSWVPFWPLLFLV